MLLNKNKVIVACAGSGKTTGIVEKALKLGKQRVLITTYTNENLDQIKAFFIEKTGCIPANVTVQSWFSFLLQEGVRPYQNQMTERGRVESIFFIEDTRDAGKLKKKLRYIPESQDSHYLTEKNYIYNDKVSKFIYNCDKRSKGLISKRLEKIYGFIFIDELQDFAGYDLNLLEILFNSHIDILAVVDPRQATFSTNTAQKNKQYKKSKIYLWLNGEKSKNKIVIEEINNCYRCNQQICDFADKLFPDLQQTVSKNTRITGHDGIFYISSKEVDAYISNYNPRILRYSKKTKTLGFPAINIGLSKGRTYDRILIFPTKPMLEYLKTKELSKAGDKIKLYVAVTRARYSVAFVVD
jgi:DNA helicase-2/ATP-dependent DNA helicase PcrA